MLDPDASRLSRLMALLILLQSKRLLTAGAIAKKFDISIRTVYRDIKALQETGVPIITGEGRGYTLMEGYTLPPVMFTETEANALITAEQLVATNKDASFVKEYTEAMTKIRAVLRNSTKSKAELLAERILVWHNFSQGSTSNYLSRIQLAITNCNLAEIQYHAESGESTRRTIEPLALYSTQGNWILIAFCRLRNENRSFRLDRIKHLVVQSETFPATNFTLQQYFEECSAKSAVAAQPLT